MVNPDNYSLDEPILPRASTSGMTVFCLCENTGDGLTLCMVFRFDMAEDHESISRIIEENSHRGKLMDAAISRSILFLS